MTAKIFLKQGKAKPFWHRHPWVYAGVIAGREGDCKTGDWVYVFDHQNQFIAKGFLDEHAHIQVRLWTWNPEESLETYLTHKIKAAVYLRQKILHLPSSKTTAYRLVHSEGDGLSGLTVDCYQNVLVAQWSIPGMEPYQSLLKTIFASELPDTNLIFRAKQEAKQPSQWVSIQEHGVYFQVDVAQGHKTGFYCDQRENRWLLTQLTKPNRVLDAFCYTGGFGVTLATKTNPKEIIFLEDSATALAVAEQNLKRNSSVKGFFKKTNVFRYLAEMVQNQEQFDTVILDPPKLAPNQKTLPTALHALKKLQTQALRLLKSSGFLVTCDCSGDITLPLFLQILQTAAYETKRDIRVLKIAGAGPDHPLNPYCPESTYLKTLFCLVF